MSTMSGHPCQRRALRRRRALQLVLAPLLGLGAALLVACGSSNNKLIPLANAGPLQNDFQEVAEKAATGNGSCGATEQALLKTEQDFAGLPGSTDAGLRERLRQGIVNLRSRALSACQQPLAQTTGTGTTGKTQTTPPQTTSTPAQTTTTQTTPPQTTTTPPTSTAPPETGGVSPEAEREKEKGGPLPGGGTGPGNGNGNGPGNGNGNGPGGLEGGR